MAKMLRRTKIFGRCPVEGHGSKCEVSKDIQEISISRTVDKRIWLEEARREIEDMSGEDSEEFIVESIE